MEVLQYCIVQLDDKNLLYQSLKIFDVTCLTLLQRALTMSFLTSNGSTMFDCCDLWRDSKVVAESIFFQNIEFEVKCLHKLCLIHFYLNLQLIITGGGVYKFDMLKV